MGHSWKRSLLCCGVWYTGASASVLQRACLQQCVVHRLCKRAGDSVCDSGVRCGVLAARFENSGSALRGKLSVSGPQYLCGDDAPYLGFYAGEGGSGGDCCPYGVSVGF